MTVDAFAATASATTVRAGQTLTVTFQSVEPISTRPTATFTQPGRTAVRVTATRLSNGSYRASFRIQAGAAGPATVRIAARDSGGHINATVVNLTIAS